MRIFYFTYLTICNFLPKYSITLFCKFKYSFNIIFNYQKKLLVSLKPLTLTLFLCALMLLRYYIIENTDKS